MVDDEKDVPEEGGGTMTPEDYAKFMGAGDEEEGAAEEKPKDDSVTQEMLDRVRLQLRQAGMITDYAQKVADGIGDIQRGGMRDFNFVRGHVKRVRVRRELNGLLTVITY